MTSENMNATKPSSKKPLAKLIVIGFLVLVVVYAISLGVAYFYFRQYTPEEMPTQPTPIGYRAIEPSPFVYIPVAFDELWTVDGTA